MPGLGCAARKRGRSARGTHRGLLSALFLVFCGAARAANATTQESDPKFKDGLLQMANLNTLLPEDQRQTVFLPNDDAFGTIGDSLTTKQVVPSVYVGTVIGNYDTTSILNNLYIQRQDNASHILQSLIGPLIFTTNLSETGSVFVRTIDMISPAKIVVPNIQTCLGFMHIVDKLLFTSVTYEELPDNITLPGEEASLAAPPSEVPDHIANSGPNSDENGNFSESEETDSGPTDFQGVLANFGNRPAGNEEDVGGGGNTNYAVVIAVSAAVAIAIGAVSCIVLVCMRDSKLFKNICKRRGGSNVISKDEGRYPLMVPNGSSSAIAPSSVGNGGFYLHHNPARNGSSEIVCPSQPFTQTPSGRIVPLSPSPARRNPSQAVSIPEVSAGGNRPPSPPDGGLGGHVTSVPQRLHNGESSTDEDGRRLFVGGLRAWESLENVTTDNDPVTMVRSGRDSEIVPYPGSRRSHSATSQRGSVTRGGRPPWGQGGAGQYPIDLEQQSVAVDSNRNVQEGSWWSGQKEGMLGWAASALNVLGFSKASKQLHSVNSQPRQQAGNSKGSRAELAVLPAPPKKLPESEVSRSLAERALSASREATGRHSSPGEGVAAPAGKRYTGEGNANSDKVYLEPQFPQQSSTSSEYEEGSRPIPKNAAQKTQPPPDAADGSVGAGLYLATRDLFKRTTGVFSSTGAKSGGGSVGGKASLRAKGGESAPGAMHGLNPGLGSTERQTLKSLGRPLSGKSHTSSKSKRTGVLIPSSGRGSPEFVEAVTNPMYQHSSNDNLGANVTAVNPAVNSKTEQSEYNGSSLPGASTGVSNFVSPLPSGLLPANEPSATVSGTDSLEVTGSNAANRSQKALQSSIPTLATLGTLQLGTHEEHASRSQNNLTMTSGDLEMDVLRAFGQPNLSISMPPRPKSGAEHPDNATSPGGLVSPAVTPPGSTSRYYDAPGTPPTAGVKSGGNFGVHTYGRSPQTPGAASNNATNPTLYHTFSTQITGEVLDEPAGHHDGTAGGSSHLSYGVFATPVAAADTTYTNAQSTFNTPRASTSPSDVAEDPEAPNVLEPCPPPPPMIPEASPPERSRSGSHASQRPSRSSSVKLSHLHVMHGSHESRKSSSHSRGNPMHLTSNPKGLSSTGGNTQKSSGGATQKSSGGNTKSGSAFLRSLKAGKDRLLGYAPGASTTGKSNPMEQHANPQAPTIGTSTRRGSSSRRQGTVYGVKTLDSQPVTVSQTREVSPPPPGADMHDWKEYLNYQLDSLREYEFLGGLVMLFGPRTRLHGGQAVVQMCAERHTARESAVKFFLSNSAFLDEAKLYQDRENKPLGRFLPEVHRIINCPVEGYTDAHGVPLPPCIVMEKGESLDHWAARGGDGVDSVTGLQVLTHVAERLTDLHAAGYVHRDIKPGNVMWLPRKNRWTLIDFGCAARTGEKARKGFSFSYAAPEVLAAVKAGKQTFNVSEALDVWSIGILAIEMFTGQPVYSCLQTKQTTLAMVLGEEPAPWECPETAKAIMKRLGHLRDAVLAALRRDPAERPTMGQFLRACHSVLNSTADTNTNTIACSAVLQALNGAPAAEEPSPGSGGGAGAAAGTPAGARAGGS